MVWCGIVWCGLHDVVWYYVVWCGLRGVVWYHFKSQFIPVPRVCVCACACMRDGVCDYQLTMVIMVNTNNIMISKSQVCRDRQ